MIRRLPHSLAAGLAFGLASTLAGANDAPRACASIDEDTARLACYDRAFGRVPVPVEDQVAKRTQAQAMQGRTLAEEWDLEGATPRPAFELRVHKPTYLLLGTHTDHVNARPVSDNPRNVAAEDQAVQPTEAQFQLSFKTKVWDHVMGSPVSAWAGYTQSSRWQVYNGNVSRPFRETNYEPEAILAMPLALPFRVAGFESRMAAVSFTHQSNGRSEPLSRSWNRVIGQWGFERGDTTVLLRPWWRVKERPDTDDNPHINDYIGRGEIVVAHRFGGQVVSVQARHSLRGGANSRGSVRLEWSLPLWGFLKAHVMVFNGYGESLLSYRDQTETVRAGISLVR